MLVAEFSAKFRSKKEVFTFLTVQCHAYLDSFHNLNIYFLSKSVSLLMTRVQRTS